MGDGHWVRLGRQVLHQDRFRRFYLDTVRLPSGEVVTYSWAETLEAAFVTPLTDRGEIILIRQYRYPVDCWLWEVPAGRLEGESGEAAARRELREEVGGTARELLYLGQFFSAAAHLRLRCNTYLALGVTLTSPTEHENTELLEVHCLPAEEALALARRAEEFEGQSALAVLMAEPLIRTRLGR
ncbi:MAG: NUDIX hydrolase [Chloroflexi bacterium]|nr:NUDIX hydrolase [Chloroflexota bacterium]